MPYIKGGTQINPQLLTRFAPLFIQPAAAFRLNELDDDEDKED